MYQYVSMVIALSIWCVGYRYFGGRFVRPKWKQVGKLVAYLGVSWILLQWVGLYAFIFIIGHQAIGVAGHIVICKKHDIDWRTSQPEDKYLALTEKWARGDFT